MRRLLQRAVIKGLTSQVDTILRFLGAAELPSEVDVEVVLQDQLTGIILVDPVTLGCGHTFGKGALVRYLQRKPQTHRLCPLCNWAIPLDFKPHIDPLVAYILARSFDDKVKADLEALQDAVSTTPLVLTVLGSYLNNTEILLKALGVLSAWAQGSAANRIVLNFHGAIEPVLEILRQHYRHQQLVAECLHLLLTLAQEEGAVLEMNRAGAFLVLLPIVQAETTTNAALPTSTVLPYPSSSSSSSSAPGPAAAFLLQRDWPADVVLQVERDLVRLIVRILGALPKGQETATVSMSGNPSGSLPMLPPALTSMLRSSGRGGSSGSVSSLVHQQLLALMEHSLEQIRQEQQQQQSIRTGGRSTPTGRITLLGKEDVSAIMMAIARLVGPTWFTEAHYELILAVALAFYQDPASSSPSCEGSDSGLWALLVKFLERAFDPVGLMKAPALAKAFARNSSFNTLEALLDKGPNTLEVCTSPLSPSSSFLVINHSRSKCYLHMD